MAARIPITRFRTIPLTLLRIQSKGPVSLRDYETQVKKKSRSFDVVLQADGLVHPVEGDFFTRPNGMSLRPVGIQFYDIMSSFRGGQIIEIPANAAVPDSLVLILEMGEHYSLQANRVMSLKELNAELEQFLLPFPRLTKDDYAKKYPIMF